jgi:hypothetical protein
MLLLPGNVITSSERSEVASMWPHDAAASCGHVLRPIPSLNIVRNQYNNQLQQEFRKHGINTARQRDCFTVNVLLLPWFRLLACSDSESVTNPFHTQEGSLNGDQLPVLPLSCASARPRSNWNAPAHTDLLPRSWNFLIMHITEKF